MIRRLVAWLARRFGDAVPVVPPGSAARISLENYCPVCDQAVEVRCGNAACEAGGQAIVPATRVIELELERSV